MASGQFHQLDPFERARCLTLLAALKELGGDAGDSAALFTQARGIDRDLAVQVYSDWLSVRAGAGDASGGSDET